MLTYFQALLVYEAANQTYQTIAPDVEANFTNKMSSEDKDATMAEMIMESIEMHGDIPEELTEEPTKFLSQNYDEIIELIKNRIL